MNRFFLPTERPSPACCLRRRVRLILVTLCLLGQLPRLNAQIPADTNDVRFANRNILAWHLSTNAAGYARGFAGNYDDKFALAGWHYDDYSGSKIARLASAQWSKTFWLAGVHGLGATCIGFTNGTGGQGLATMVSPRHCLFATHMHPDGRLMAFLGTNNVMYWRTAIERTDIGNDIAVGILDADLPAAVEFLPVLPPDFARYLPTNEVAFVQGIGMNQDWRIFGQPMTFMYPGIVAWSPRGAAPFGLGTNWNVAIRGGDSSNPEMLLIGRQLVLVAHTSTAQTGANYATHFDEINRAMHQLSVKHHLHTDYQLTPFSLTNWPVVNP